MEDLISRTAEAAADWWAQRLQSGDQAKFKDVLRPLVEKDLRERGHCDLECDYDPHGHLLTAVREAVDPRCRGFMFSAKGILPQKHDLDVRPGAMEPKEGYGNWTDKITIS